MDDYSQFPPPEGNFRTLEGGELWRRAKMLARDPATEPEALAALERYYKAWSTRVAARGFGYGAEIVVGLDLAVRLGAPYEGWLRKLGPKLLRSDGVLEALCLPPVAGILARGALRHAVGLSEAQLADAFARIEAAASQGIDDAPSKLVPGTTLKRSVSCEYSQFYLEHHEARAIPEYFRDRRDSEQGMSIFPGNVSIGTPTETLSCDVEISVATSAPASLDLDGAVQAVCFPLAVSGPLVLRSVSAPCADGEPFEIANGDYDVLAVFRAHRRRPRSATALRRFALTLRFFPRGMIDAPRCLRLEEAQPPASIVVHGSSEE
jgi:hypothetical protein